MRWLIAGLLFALAVTLAIGTAAMRASNVCARRRIEQNYRLVEDRIIELRRLDMAQLAEASPERLAERHRMMLRGELRRREERLQ